MKYRRKRILYLSRGGSISGSQRQLYYVISNLDKKLYEPIVVCPKDGQFVTKLQNSGIKTYVLPLRPWRKFPSALCRYMDAEHLTRFARQHKIALIHSSDLWLNRYLIWVSRRLKIPSILHVRTPILPEEVHKHGCDKATSIISISLRVKQNLLQAGIGNEKIVQIDDGVDLNVFRPQTPYLNVLRREFLPQGEILIGIVGRIQPAKKQLDFLKCAEQFIRNSTKTVTLFIIGEIRSDSYFEQISRFISEKGLKQHTVFMGRRNDMPEILSSLDILVSLSGGSVMFEAMACSKAVVSAGFSTRKNSVHLQDRRTGILVESKQISVIAQAITRLIDAPELRMQLGLEARKWAKNNFSRTAMASKTQQLYEQLLQEQGFQMIKHQY